MRNHNVELWTFGIGRARAAFMVMNNDDVFCIGKHVETILSGKKDAKFPTKIEALCGKGVKGEFHTRNICRD